MGQPNGVPDSVCLFVSGSQAARVANRGTGGARVGAGGGAHNPSNRPPAGMLDPL